MKKRIEGVATITPSWYVNFRSGDVAVKTIDEAETMNSGDGRRAVVVGDVVKPLGLHDSKQHENEIISMST